MVEDIKRKIASLLRLAKDQAATPAEAAAAASKAQELADKHRLDLAAILTEEQRQQVIGSAFPVTNAAGWRRIVWNRVAVANGCMTVWQGYKKTMNISATPPTSKYPPTWRPTWRGCWTR